MAHVRSGAHCDCRNLLRVSRPMHLLNDDDAQAGAGEALRMRVIVHLRKPAVRLVTLSTSGSSRMLSMKP